MEQLREHGEEGYILESGLSRVFQMAGERPYATLSAWRDQYTRTENRVRNRKLEQDLNAKKAGAIKLTGVWVKPPEGVAWDEARDSGNAQYLEEESFFVSMPKGMEMTEFKAFMVSLMRKYDQDAICFGTGEEVVLVHNNGTEEKISDNAKPTFSKMNQLYSKIRGKDVPFVFEGTIAPSNNFHRLAMKTRGLQWFEKMESF